KKSQSGARSGRSKSALKLCTICSRFSKRAKQSRHDQNDSRAEQKKICPWEIARGGESSEKDCVTQKTCHHQGKPEPQRPVPSSFGHDAKSTPDRISLFAFARRQIHR